jgi:hypothetical protein
VLPAEREERKFSLWPKAIEGVGASCIELPNKKWPRLSTMLIETEEPEKESFEDYGFSESMRQPESMD